MNARSADVYSVIRSSVGSNIKFCINTVLPLFEKTMHNILGSSFGIMSYLLFLHVYSGMSIGSSLRNSHNG